MAWSILMFDPISIIFGLGCIFLGGSVATLAFTWENIIFSLRGKKIAVLGERRVGKTTLLTYISKGIFINLYDATLASKKVEKTRLSLNDLDIKIKKTKDVSGADDLGAYREWQKLFIPADIVLYIVRADKLLDKNPETKNRAITDLDNFKSWSDESEKKRRWVFIIGNVWEPHSEYSSIQDSGEYVKFLEKFQQLDSVEKMTQIARRSEANEVRVVLGSLANKESANKLITVVFSQVINNGQ